MGLALLAGIATVAILRWNAGSSRPLSVAARPAATVAVSTDNGRASIALYYPSADLSDIREVRRVVPDLRSDRTAWVQTLFDGLNERPDSDLLPLFPPGLRVRHVFLDDRGTLYVDLPGSVSEAPNAGVEVELLTVKALTRSLLSNVEGARRLKLLVEGTDRDDLWGHVQLRKPLEVF